MLDPRWIKSVNNEYIGKNSPLGTGGKKRQGRDCIGCMQYLWPKPNRQREAVYV